MSFAKLHIFNKNTDANPSIRGYNYQTLKTVETWIDNFNNEDDEEIFCDFEEDIFQKNEKLKTAKFRQIKLYSRNFSFASKDIKKCISHFFLLHVKTNHEHFDKEFIFETNKSVANPMGENDAELLKNWASRENDLTEKLLEQCVKKVKKIVTEYVEAQTKTLENKVGEDDENLIEAIKVFNNLEDNFWSDFVKKIKWKFNDVSPEEEMERINKKIENSILNLPFKNNEKSLSLNFGVLFKEVFDRASANDPKDRKLTTTLLSKIILEPADEKEKWYWEVYSYWNENTETKQFRIGTFYEMLDAIVFCWSNTYLSIHDRKWETLLIYWIENDSITEYSKRRAIYELVFLKDARNYEENQSKTSNGIYKYIEYYFNDFDVFTDPYYLREACNLLIKARTIFFFGKDKPSLKKIEEWVEQLIQIVHTKLQTAENPNEICTLNEIDGLYNLLFHPKRNNENTIIERFQPFENILANIDNGMQYDVEWLYENLNKYINQGISVESRVPEEQFVQLEEFSNKLKLFVDKRYAANRSEKEQLERAKGFLKNPNEEGMLKAINRLHKVKDFFLESNDIEYYVNTVSAISDYYSLLHLNFAAKYYAFNALWPCLHDKHHKLYKKIPDAFYLLFYSDFKQGSWLNALTSFSKFIEVNEEFNPIFNVDELRYKSLDFLLILCSTTKISTQFNILINMFKNLFEVGFDFLIPMYQCIDSCIQKTNDMEDLLKRKLTDNPLNDVGKKRYVRFNALGIFWEVSFENNYETTPIAEEFCAIMQIMLAELALSKDDLHLLKGSVKIVLDIGNEKLPPEQIPSNTELIWRIYLNFFDSKQKIQIAQYFAETITKFTLIIKELSLLPEEEFDTKYYGLFKKMDSMKKIRGLSSYQRIYRYILKKEGFDEIKREDFEPVDYSIEGFPVENSLLKWNNTLSEKFNQKKSIEHIELRFRNSYKSIYLTVDKLKTDSQFQSIIKKLRDSGYLDWQIIESIKNFILDYKAKLQVEQIEFYSNEQEERTVVENFSKLQHIDEKECYVDFPFDAFQSESFNSQLESIPVLVLGSFGLINNARFPNYKAIKEFLDIRFNMKNDNSDEGNLLVDI